MLRSLALVIGCYVLSVVLVLLTDPLLSALFPGDFVAGRIPSTPPLLASTGLFILISILCAWLCARHARTNPWRHVLWFLVLGELMGIAATIPNWSRGWPHWYQLSWLLSWPVSCWLGWRLATRAAGRTEAEPAP